MRRHLVFVGCEAGKTRARFEWKRVRHCTELPWPAPGASLTMNYKLPAEALANIAVNRLVTELCDRVLIYADDLSKQSDGWRIHKGSYENASFMHEGKFWGNFREIQYVRIRERQLPEGVKFIQCKIDPGTDQSASWGPGIALVWKDRVVKFYLRPGKSEFGVFDGRSERLIGDSRRWQTILPENGDRRSDCFL